MSRCENCRAYNAHVIVVHEGESKQLLCPRCLTILKEMDKEYYSIVMDNIYEGLNIPTQIPISSHRGEDDA